MTTRRSLTAAMLAFALTMPFGAPAMAANPGTSTTSTGQSLSIQIDSPTDGSRVGVPSGSVTVTGTAAIGPLTESGNVLYVVDVSGSTQGPTNRDCNGDGVVNALDNVNGDGFTGNTLDCEIAGVIALNTSLTGSPGAEGGLIIFAGGAAIADVGPAGGIQQFASPLDADENHNGEPDLHEAARSLRSSGEALRFTHVTVSQSGTNFDAALTAIRSAFASKAGEKNIAFFLSDGHATTPMNLTPTGALASVAAAGIIVHTYSVGGSSTGCGPTADLRRIANATGGTCTDVVDPSDLSSVLVNPTTISKVEVSLNGGAPITATLTGNSFSLPLTLQGGIWNSITATVTASDGTTATAEVQVYGNQAPTADAGGPYTVNEGSPLVLNGMAADPDGDVLTISWTPSTHLSNPGAANPTFQADDDMVESLMMTVTDPDGMSATAVTTVTVLNVAPTATLAAPAAVNEGETFTVGMHSPYDPSAADTAAGFLYAFACDGATFGAYSSSAAAACQFADGPSSQTVAGRIMDKDGGVSEYHATVQVMNVAPSLGAIAAPTTPVAVGSALTASAAFTDPGILDTHTATFDWGDGSSSAGTVTEAGGSGSVSGSHSYSTPGVYTITLTVTDKDGGVASGSYQYVVVYDPSGGFVTGGGWIATPAGKANFGFNAKYKKGALVPDGQLQFQDGDLNFHSTSFQWLVAAGAKAQLLGSGKVNGAGEYGFLLTASDGSPDKFRIKIWEKGSGTVIYDTQMGAGDDADPTTVLGGGSIVIH